MIWKNQHRLISDMIILSWEWKLLIKKYLYNVSWNEKPFTECEYVFSYLGTNHEKMATAVGRPATEVWELCGCQVDRSLLCQDS